MSPYQSTGSTPYPSPTSPGSPFPASVSLSDVGTQTQEDKEKDAVLIPDSTSSLNATKVLVPASSLPPLPSVTVTPAPEDPKPPTDDKPATAPAAAAAAAAAATAAVATGGDDSTLPPLPGPASNTIVISATNNPYPDEDLDEDGVIADTAL